MEFVRKRKANAITELREIGARAKLKCLLVLEWRNWHTQQTQNLTKQIYVVKPARLFLRRLGPFWGVFGVYCSQAVPKFC